MLDFFYIYATQTAFISAIIAFKQVRRWLKVARGQISPVDMTLVELQVYRDPYLLEVFGDPQRIFTFSRFSFWMRNPVIQFLYRWSVYFPVGFLGMIIYPLTWLYALPSTIVVWILCMIFES